MTDNRINESKQILLSILGDTPFGIVVFGFHGELLLINKPAAEIIAKGNSVNRLLSKNILDFFEEGTGVYNSLKESIEFGRVSTSWTHEAYKEFYLNIKLRPFINGSILTLDDCTETVHATERAMRARELEVKNKELEQFAYIASHDLQEPLNTVQGFINLIELKFKEEIPEEVLSYLSRMTHSMGRMSAQIRGLLEYSRIGTNQEKAEVNTQEIFEDLFVDLGQQIERTGAQITIEGELPSLQVYHQEFRSLVKNFLTNAMKYVAKGVEPRVFISHTALKHADQFSIRDNGLGIAPKDQEKVFEMFSRVGNNKDYDGTGIGLAHCMKIVQMHGGEVWIDSEVGKGSTFHFTIARV